MYSKKGDISSLELFIDGMNVHKKRKKEEGCLS